MSVAADFDREILDVVRRIDDNLATVDMKVGQVSDQLGAITTALTTLMVAHEGAALARHTDLRARLGEIATTLDQLRLSDEVDLEVRGDGVRVGTAIAYPSCVPGN